MQAYRTLPGLLNSRAFGLSSRTPFALSFARHITTQRLTPAENLELLNQQRNLRPNSPWDIYQPQLTSASSIAHRGTGVGMALSLYAFYIGYAAVLPAVGYPIDSEALVSFATSLPVWLKYAIKTTLALPFTYHFYNGLRHLAWDRGYFLQLKTGYQAAYAVFTLAGLTAAGLVLL